MLKTQVQQQVKDRISSLQRINETDMPLLRRRRSMKQVVGDGKLKTEIRISRIDQAKYLKMLKKSESIKNLDSVSEDEQS